MPKNKKPKRKTGVRLVGTPAVLPQRPEQKHNRFTSTGNFTGTLDAVALTISTTATKDNEYSLPDLEGDVYRTLRQYGLILARYQIADKAKFARRYKHEPKIIDTACRIVANYLFTEIYGFDPSVNTVHLFPLQAALGLPEPSVDAILATQAYIGTEAFRDLANDKVIKNPDILEALQFTGRELDELGTHRYHDTDPMPHYLKQIVKSINSEHKGERTNALKVYDYVCSHLENTKSRADHNRLNRQTDEQRAKEKADQKKRQEQKSKQHYRSKPLESTTMVGWERVVIGKPELTISHTGLIGRRIIAAREGKYVRDLGRIISDPEQRIFGRKTKALGGVVIVDCSGSMSLTDEEMKDIMKSSSGCTVIAYSSRGDEADGEPNVWLVARRGRQVRRLPYFPGGNGVDGPALEYGLSFRTHNAPVVWISDTHVTGANGYSQNRLRDVCLRLCRKHNIHVARDCETATDILTKLQRGQRVIPNIPKSNNEEE